MEEDEPHRRTRRVHCLVMAIAVVLSFLASASSFNNVMTRGDESGPVPLSVPPYIGPNQTAGGDLGSKVFYFLLVSNNESFDDYINVEGVAGPQGWQVTLYMADGITLLTDSPGDLDNTADVGLILALSAAVIQVSVQIPSVPGVQDWDVSSVKASMSSNPSSSWNATLTTKILPYECPTVVANPSTIWRSDAPPSFQPKQTILTLNVKGRGMYLAKPRNQDTIFLMDSTGSMTMSDPTDLRLAAAKHYVDLLQIPDRAAVIDFDDFATLVNGHHLSSDYVQIKADIDTIDSNGGTDLVNPIHLGVDEHIAYGDVSHIWAQILLTDGDSINPDAAILAEAQRAKNNNIIIFTIGLGDYVKDQILTDVAELTGGVYLKAQTANDLDSIFVQIAGQMKSIAGYDNDVTDEIPMINVFLPSYISYVPGSGIPIPAYKGVYNGMTNLQWNLSSLRINETWTARITVTSSLEGTGLPPLALPESRVTYFRYDDTRVDFSFLPTQIDVLFPQLPDLVASPSDFFIVPAPPYLEGTVVSISAAVRNLGTDSSDDTVARFSDGNPPGLQIGQDQQLGTIDIGDISVVTVLWTASGPGNHRLCVFADPDDIILELSESNNVACVNVVVNAARPDYVPVDLAPGTPLKVPLSSCVQLSLTILNQGNRTGGTATLAFLNESSPTAFATFTVPPLAPSARSMQYFATWLHQPIAGTYRIVADVDYNDDLVEWDELNNRYIWTIEVVNGPITSLVVGSPSYVNGSTFITSHSILSLAVDDRSGAGIKRTLYRIDHGGWIDYASTGSFFLSTEGEHLLEWFSEDNPGNVESIVSEKVIVDNSPPVTTLGIGVPMYVSGQTYVTSTTQLTLDAEDKGLYPVGVNATMLREWNGTWSQWEVSTSVHRLLGADGTRFLEYFSMDFLNNTGPIINVTIVLDNSPPHILMLPEEARVPKGTFFAMTAHDGQGSGVAMIEYIIDGDAWQPYAGQFTLDLGDHKIGYRAVDNLGWRESGVHYVKLTVTQSRSMQVTVNYKPVVAVIFSMILGIAASASARRRPMRWGKTDRRRIAISWSILAIPIIALELATGGLSYVFEPLRIPPVVGWGMALDSSILAAGIAIFIVRLVVRRHRPAEDEIPPPPPPEDWS